MFYEIIPVGSTVYVETAYPEWNGKAVVTSFHSDRQYAYNVRFTSPEDTREFVCLPSELTWLT